jgi:hypothetical protein
MKQISSKRVLFILSLLGLGSTINFSDYDSRSCMNNNGVYCLTSTDFSSGVCCDPLIADCSASNQMYCVDTKNNNIKNAALRKFVNP